MIRITNNSRLDIIIIIYNTQVNLLQYKSMTTEDNLGSLLDDANSTDDLVPQQLSGDENAEKSLIMSDITGSKSNFLLTVTTIMKTVIGAGILSLPLTVSRLGYVLCLLIFLFVITVMQFCVNLLLKSKNLSKHSNYSSIAYHIFRTKIAQMVCSAMILLNNTGICIAEVLIIKKAVNRIFEGFIAPETRDGNFFLSEFFVALVVALLESPFTMVNKIEKLKILAFVGVSGITTFVLILTIVFFILMGESPRDWSCSPDMVAFANKPLEMAVVIPNMLLALAYSMNFFPIFKGMKDARDEKMSKASITGVIACSIFYILVGNMGYCLFGNNLQGNFLLAFNRGVVNDALYLLLNISFLISVFFSFPVMFFGARNNFIAITNGIVMFINKKKGQYRQQESDNIEEISSYIQTEDKIRRKKQAKILFFVYTLILFGCIVAVAASVDDVEDVFNIVGAIASNSIAFIFPCLFYVMLIRKKNKPKKPQYWGALAAFCFFVPFGIFAVISKFISHESGH